MIKNANTSIRRGTNNVFADLDFPDAETYLLKAELVTRIQEVITRQNLIGGRVISGAPARAEI